jgi:hypothetical protein
MESMFVERWVDVSNSPLRGGSLLLGPRYCVSIGVAALRTLCLYGVTASAQCNI